MSLPPQWMVTRRELRLWRRLKVTPPGCGLQAFHHYTLVTPDGASGAAVFSSHNPLEVHRRSAPGSPRPSTAVRLDTVGGRAMCRFPLHSGEQTMRVLAQLGLVA